MHVLGPWPGGDAARTAPDRRRAPPIAIGSYFKIDATTAEVAFAVDDQSQGNGLGTLLLQRLATLAAAQGFTRFEAVTLPDNRAMLDVFHASGLEIRSKNERGAVDVLLALPALDAR